jgi:soluble lytic murein transglycosylase-like protein
MPQAPQDAMVGWDPGPPGRVVEHGSQKAHSGIAPPGSNAALVVQSSVSADDISKKIEQELKFFEQKKSNPRQPYSKNIPYSQTVHDTSLTLNKQVQHYIRYFQTEGRITFRRQLSRSMQYKDLMQGILREYHLPEDLFYVALVESGFNLNAYSDDHASGPWQLTAGTARRYGLKINRRIDERRDPVKSTHAAARYLSDLHKEFGCWYLALAAYNTGEGNIDRAIRRGKTSKFWELCANGSVKKQIQRHVSKVLASAIIARQPEKYGFSDPAQHTSSDKELLSDYVSHRIRHGETLSSIARAYGTTVNAILVRNGITQPDRILVGQTIMVLRSESAAQTKSHSTPPPELHADKTKTLFSD